MTILRHLAGNLGRPSASNRLKTMNVLWRRHWPEYLMEGAELGLFMISACLLVALLEHPDSPVHQALPDPFLRRVLMGIAMGTTAVAIIFSPLGKRSGAHFNPAVTLTFWRLKKVDSADAIAYIAFQFVGGAVGVAVAAILLGGRGALPRRRSPGNPVRKASSRERPAMHLPVRLCPPGVSRARGFRRGKGVTWRLPTVITTS